MSRVSHAICGEHFPLGRSCETWWRSSIRGRTCGSTVRLTLFLLLDASSPNPEEYTARCALNFSRLLRINRISRREQILYQDSSRREADELSFLEELTNATIQLARARLYPGKSGDLACHLDISSTDEESRTVNSTHATNGFSSHGAWKTRRKDRVGIKRRIIGRSFSREKKKLMHQLVTCPQFSLLRMVKFQVQFITHGEVRLQIRPCQRLC